MTDRRRTAVGHPVVAATTLLLVFALPCLARRSGGQRAAHKAYVRAVRARVELEARPERARPLREYERVIRSFQLVYRLDPAYAKAPAALAEGAELRERMGREFSDDRYYPAAIEGYQFLRAQYPHALLSRDALFTIGEIYRSDLEDPDEARKAFARFLREYPRSTKAGEAQARVEQIDRLLAHREARRPTWRATSPTAGEQANAASPAPPAGPEAGRSSELTDIRDWQGADYTRVVINLEKDVKFDSRRLSNPDRIVFDLAGTRLSPALAGRTFPVGNGFLRQVRVAQFAPTVTRVVLDVEKIQDYSVFSLPNPFRLVIDVRGPPGPALGAAQPRTTESANAGHMPASGSTSETPPDSADAASGDASSDGSRSTTEAPEESTTSLPRPSAALARPAAPLSTGSTTLTRALGLKVARIVIDPGHGGHDTGTIGPGGLREKDLVLDVSLRLRRLIERRTGAEVIMTRSDDTFIPLEERTAIANQKAADLFISVHANASRDESARGIETYYLNFTSNPESLETAARENATSQESVHQLQSLIKQIALTEKIQESRQFASDVQSSLYTAVSRAGSAEPNRGLKNAPFVVLIGARMPSILAEISFLTNPRDERLLRRPEYRQKIAEGLYQGVARYIRTLSSVQVAERSGLRSTRDLAATSPRARRLTRSHVAAPSASDAPADPPNR